MKENLNNIKDDLRSFKSLALIGLRKNVGKTTTLNSILEILDYKEVMLTSIGYDGESSDLVFNTIKPTIQIKKGMLLATAKKCLLASDIHFEIMETTGFISPLGEIVIAKALSDGLVELAGPSSNYQLKRVNEILNDLAKGLIIVDGALNRVSFSDPTICEKTILCTGMVLSNDIDDMIKQTKYAYNLLSLKQVNVNDYQKLLKYDENIVTIFNEDNIIELDYKTTINKDKEIVSYLNESSQYLLLNGPLSDNLAKELIKNRKKLNNLTIVVKNGTQIFIGEDIYNQLMQTNKFSLKVLEPIDIYAISVNPCSLNNCYDSKEIISKLEKEVECLVVDFVGGR